MALTPQDIARVANLARLELRPDETEHNPGPTQRLFLPWWSRWKPSTPKGWSRWPTRRPVIGEVALRLREDVASEPNQREASQVSAPAVENGLYPRPQGDRMSTATNNTALHDLGVAQLAAKLAAHEVSSAEATQHFLDPHRRTNNLGAFLATDARRLAGPGQGRRRAPAPPANARRCWAYRWRTRTCSSRATVPTTAGSKILANYRSPFDATVVRKLGPQGAGMVTLGKLNCDEFAMGSGNENSRLQAREETRGTSSRVPGGSSGGSAAAVAARLVPGRHRHRHRRLDPPAGRADCGITGIKPTYGRVLALRHGGLRLPPGPGRPDGAQRARTARCCSRP